MPRFHRPNALDAAFLALDEAWRRCGLWGADIHFYLELAGRLDVAGLREALRALYRLYPAMQARLVHSHLSRHPAWRLDVESPDLERVVDVRELEPATEPELQRRIEELLAGRLDLATGPPLRFVVFRGLPAGDFVVMRWPHALMDARGGETILRELARLFEERSDPRTLRSVGDESRTDFGALSPASLAQLARALFVRDRRPGRPADWREARLCSATTCSGQERMRFFVRRLSPEQSADVRATATRVCGFARVAEFVRACAVRALHEVTSAAGTAGHGYSTLILAENRRRRDPGPVAHNIFSTMPVFVPAALAADRRAVADLIQEATAQLLRPGVMERQLAGLRLLGRMPTRTLARLIARGLRSGRSWLPMGFSNSPALPLGFINLLARPLKSFCGAELVNLFGVRAASPLAGLGVNVVMMGARMNIAGVYVEPHVSDEVANAFLERFLGGLTEVD